MLVFVLNTGGAIYAATLTTSVAVFAVASTVSVLRYRSVEIDLVLRRAFIVAGVAGASLIVFLAIFLLVDLVAGPSVGGIAGGLVIALLGVPVRNGVSSRVGRLLYGHRDTARAIEHVSLQLDLASQPADALPELARAVAEAIGASAVAIEPAPSSASAPAIPATSCARLSSSASCVTADGPLGRVLIGARAPGEQYSPADVALVEILVRQIAPARRCPQARRRPGAVARGNRQRPRRGAATHPARAP